MSYRQINDLSACNHAALKIKTLTGGERQCRLDTSSVCFIVYLGFDSQRIRLRNVIRWLFYFLALAVAAFFQFSFSSKSSLISRGISFSAFMSCVSSTANCLMFSSVVGVHFAASGQFEQREGTIAVHLAGLKETDVPQLLQTNSIDRMSVISPESLLVSVMPSSLFCDRVLPHRTLSVRSSKSENTFGQREKPLDHRFQSACKSWCGGLAAFLPLVLRSESLDYIGGSF